MKLSVKAVALALSLAAVAPAASAKVTINVWQPWGGTLGSGMIQIGKAYEKLHPNIKVNMVTVDNSLATNTKFFAAMAAGAPPEVVFVDGPQVIQWAGKNVLTNLTPLASTGGVKATDFFTPSWKQCLSQGKLYALPFITDGNFPLLYNKAIFNESGLSGPPTSTEEIELYSRKINKVDANGKYTRFGFSPWAFPGANGMFTWGFAFGGEFFDDAKDKMTVNDPKVVKALEWCLEYGRKMDQTKMNAFGTNFLGGKLGMTYAVSATLIDLKKLKTPMDWGWGFIPGPSVGGEKQSGWIGGWTVSIPANAKNRDEAWRFMKWMCHSDDGTELTYKATGFPPSARISPVFDKIDKEMAPWAEVMKIAKHTRPVMPVTPVMFSELDLAVSQALAGKKSPVAALNTANINIQKELDRALARIKGRK